jgi:hypothetical protein
MAKSTPSRDDSPFFSYELRHVHQVELEDAFAGSFQAVEDDGVFEADVVEVAESFCADQAATAAALGIEAESVAVFEQAGAEADAVSEAVEKQLDRFGLVQELESSFVQGDHAARAQAGPGHDLGPQMRRRMKNFPSS